MSIHVLCPHCGTEFELTQNGTTHSSETLTDGTYFLVPKTASNEKLMSLIDRLNAAKMTDDGTIIIPPESQMSNSFPKSIHIDNINELKSMSNIKTDTSNPSIVESDIDRVRRIMSMGEYDVKSTDASNDANSDDKINTIDTNTSEIQASANIITPTPTKTYSDEYDDLDDIEKTIMYDGYIDNSKLWRRWIMAQMLRHCDEYDTDGSNISDYGYGPGFDKYFISGKDYKYIWDTTLNELKAIRHMHGDDLKSRTRFYNHDVVFQMLDRYVVNIRRYINRRPKWSDLYKTPLSKLKNVKVDPNTIYVKMPYNKNYKKIYLYNKDKVNNIDNFINEVKDCIDKIKTTTVAPNGYVNYNALYLGIKTFMKEFPINVNLPKPNAWKNAFKGAGSFYTMDNMIKFHGCRFENRITHEKLSRENSLKLLNQYVELYKDEYYKLYATLREFMKYNDFNYQTLCERITTDI